MGKTGYGKSISFTLEEGNISRYAYSSRAIP